MPNLLEKSSINLHKGIYRVSGGRMMGRFDNMPVLMLTTTGRKSGKSRTTPLMFMEEEGAYVVVGSAAGRGPAPRLVSEFAGGAGGQRADSPRSTPRSAPALWRATIAPACTAPSARPPSATADYQAKTDREIPVVVLEPRD